MNAVAELPVTELQRLEHSALLPLDQIKPNPWNRTPKPEALQELATNLAKVGVLQPIVVRAIDAPKAGTPPYEIVAGERRWRASQLAGLKHIPAVVKVLTDLEVIELMLVENLQREGLHPLDEAEGYSRLLRRADGLQGFESITALAKHFDKSPSYVTQRLKLLSLCDAAKKAFRAGELDFSHVRAISMLANPADQAEATKEILNPRWGNERMSAREAWDHVQRTYMLALDRAIFKVTDETLVPDAGSCQACPKRTGSNPDLFGDIKKADTCTDPSCYERKEEAHRARLKAQAEAKGMTVISGAEAKKAKGLLALDETHYNIATKPLRQLLGKKLPEVQLLEDPQTKALVEVVREADVVPLLKERGVIKQGKLPNGSADLRERDREAREETAWRTAVAQAIIDHAGAEKGADLAYRWLLLQELAAHTYHRLDYDATKRVCKLMGWGEPAGEATKKRVRELVDAELCRFFTAAVIVGQVHAGTYNYKGKPATLLAMAGALGVDAAALKAQLKAAKAPKAKPQPKAEKPAKATKPGAAKPAIKYRDPDTGSTWTGRGLQPAWLKAAMANGKTLADFAV